ncbi:alpha amylase catalytic region [Gloeothece citriformis PCC 7424]|uniref:Alpha amylase catalytic region n=1 Tax=Gloeothece citriformis (strain PCC 7424) TaxID=65393 RepID=B7K6U3_GLOC7|nr:alpha-amylase family glycosyl hydrolase [Gloeothece citriformis]ACK72642.1 alpha amylase catalytic region [Gloeothece citriformis PCC 7424]
MSKSIDFQLFAPYNQEAVLIGSFSEWQPIPMKKDDKGYFRTEVKLEDGEYEYKFRVRSKSWFLEPDQWVYIVDPYATKVIDNSEQNGIICIKDGQKFVDTYVWQHDDKPLPQNHELVIYEMHIPSFGGGNYQQAIEKLDYLSDLGINAIQLMPVQEYAGEDNWGYLARYFFAAESSYGSTEELKHFIDECHGRGIRVFMDMMLNHSEQSSPLTQIDHNYWYHHEARDPQNSWGPEFNYEHYDENLDIKPAWNFAGDVVRFWIEEYHIDGIRYDAARQLANYDFMHWIVEETKKTAGSKPFYNIAEHIPDTPNITNFDGPMDGCWHDSFYYLVTPAIWGDSFDLEDLKKAIDCKLDGYMGVTNVINYLSNHDKERLMISLGERNIFDDAAFKKAKLGAVLVMTAIGLPMIWMGEEFGNSQNKQMEHPSEIDWSLLNNERNLGLLEYYKGLIQLRKNNPAFFTENVDFFHENSETKVFVYGRWNDEGSRVVVVANFSENYLAGYVVPEFPADGTWHEWTRDYDVEVKDRQLMIDLAEYEAQVFIN